MLKPFNYPKRFLFCNPFMMRFNLSQLKLAFISNTSKPDHPVKEKPSKAPPAKDKPHKEKPHKDKPVKQGKPDAQKDKPVKK
jgi:hypothetical protein